MSDGAWHVHGERTLRTEYAGAVVLEPGAVLWLRATVGGDVRVGRGARCHVLAEVHGTVHVEGGVVVLGAPVRGGVVRDADTPAAAVRAARPGTGRRDRPVQRPSEVRSGTPRSAG